MEQLYSVGPNSIYNASVADYLREQIKRPFQIIYLDPPFGKDRKFTESKGSFDDMSIGNLKNLMAPVVQLCKDSLKEDGVLIIHLDPTASHYIKVLADGIMGRKSFVNEVVWRRAVKGASKKMAWNHDTILIYAKNASSFKFHPEIVPVLPSTIKRYDKIDNYGRKFCYRTITARGSTNYWDFGPGITPPKPHRGYGWSKERIERGLLDGKLVAHPVTGNIVQKVYLDESKGRFIDDIWDDISYLPTGEKLGYPTQKPQALMERVVKMFSGEGEWVLDGFAGTGAFAYSAFKLGRHFVATDINKDACELVHGRFAGIPDDGMLDV